MKTALLLCLCTALAGPAFADGMNPAISIFAVTETGVGDPIGTIAFKDSKKGLLLLTRLAGLPPGEHGIHVHENPDCSALMKDGKPVPAGAAGSHFDPAKAAKHLGPDGAGHKGDLPFLKVSGSGVAHETLLAPHVTLADLRGHAIVIHAGGDNYSDEPKPLGGGGARIACGVMP